MKSTVWGYEASVTDNDENAIVKMGFMSVPYNGDRPASQQEKVGYMISDLQNQGYSNIIFKGFTNLATVIDDPEQSEGIVICYHIEFEDDKEFKHGETGAIPAPWSSDAPAPSDLVILNVLKAQTRNQGKLNMELKSWAYYNEAKK